MQQRAGGHYTYRSPTLPRMLVELVGGRYCGAVVNTPGLHPEMDLRIPVGAELSLRAFDVHAHVSPELETVHYRLRTEPRHGSGARFIYRYVRD